MNPSLKFYQSKARRLALVIFSLAVPFVIFITAHEQQHAAQAPNPYVVTPTLYCLGSCEYVQVSETPSGIPSGTVMPTMPGTTQSPIPTEGTPPASPSSTIAPCEAETVSVQHRGKKKHKKKRNGAIGNGMNALLRFFIELINLLLRLIGGGPLPMPTDPCNPTPSTEPTQPSPSGEPTVSPSDTPGVTSQPTGGATTAPSPSTGAGPSGTPAGWQLVASDDFNGTSVDTSKWMIYSGAGNAGVGTRNPSAVTVSNGELKITGKGDVSGGMAHKVSQTYGRWDVRAKIDKGAGYGPAMMLWPSGSGGGGDIAFSEIPKGDRSQSVFTIHWGGQQKGYNSKGDFSQWHTFTTEWEQGKVTYYIDGQQQLAWTSSDAQIPTNPLALVLQNDIGACGSWIGCRDASTPAEVSLHVDWIRVYKR